MIWGQISPVYLGPGVSRLRGRFKTPRLSSPASPNSRRNVIPLSPRRSIEPVPLVAACGVENPSHSVETNPDPPHQISDVFPEVGRDLETKGTRPRPRRDPQLEHTPLESKTDDAVALEGTGLETRRFERGETGREVNHRRASI